MPEESWQGPIYIFAPESEKFRDNFDDINWKKESHKPEYFTQENWDAEMELAEELSQDGTPNTFKGKSVTNYKDNYDDIFRKKPKTEETK